MGTTEMDEVDMVERWEAKKRDLEEAQLRRTFDGVDEDGSGEIEPPEFKRLCRRLDARLSDEVVAEAWRQIDEDGSGSADFREFEMWWNSQNGRELRGVQDEEAPKWSYKQLLAAVRPRPALPKIPGSERLKVVGGVVGQVAERQAQRQEAAALAKAARTERLAIDRAARRVSTQTPSCPSMRAAGF